jgi:hypothetical protein
MGNTDDTDFHGCGNVETAENAENAAEGRNTDVMDERDDHGCCFEMNRESFLRGVV